MNEFKLPFSRSPISPSMNELRGLFDWLKEWGKNKKCNILEFGCGPTTYCLYNALDINIYVAMEDYQKQ